MSADKLKAMFPHASASTLKRNPEFAVKRKPFPVLTPFDKLELAVDDIYPVKPNKYRNVKVEYEGMKFDSKHELKCWQDLELREKAGEITGLCRQVPFQLIVNGRHIGKFTADFTWYENGEGVVADAKSPATRKETAYRLRKKIFEAQYAPLVIREL